MFYLKIRSKNHTANGLRRVIRSTKRALLRLGSTTPTAVVFPYLRPGTEVLELNSVDACQISGNKTLMKQAFDEAQDSDRKGGWATFIVLAVLFIFIQLLGILFGMKWGFAGKKSEEAFNYIDGFDNKQDYIEYYKRKKESISRIAEQKLKLLQQRMNQRGTQISSSAEGMNLLITLRILVHLKMFAEC